MANGFGGKLRGVQENDNYFDDATASIKYKFGNWGVGGQIGARSE